MLIISDDNLFKQGLTVIAHDLSLARLVILDTGRHLYFFKDTYLRHSDDPVRQWLNLHYVSLRKDTSIKNIRSVIKSGLWKNDKTLNEQVTDKEAFIIQLLMNGVSQRQIGKNTGIAEKTVSYHKKSVLHKKHEKNITTLFRAIYTWSQFQKESRQKIAA